MPAHIHPAPQHVDPGLLAPRPSEAILAALGGRSMQDPASELLRTPLLGNKVNRAANAHSSCPDSRIAALCLFSFRAGESGCNHSETCVGCIVSLTTPTRSSLKASRSVSSLSLAEKASRVFLASYFLRLKRLSMNDWMQRLIL